MLVAVETPLAVFSFLRAVLAALVVEAHATASDPLTFRLSADWAGDAQEVVADAVVAVVAGAAGAAVAGAVVAGAVVVAAVAAASPSSLASFSLSFPSSI